MNENSESSYRRATAFLRPSREKMAKIHAEGHARANAARDSVRADLEAGASASELYERETDKERRVILVGVLRGNKTALEHFPRKR